MAKIESITADTNMNTFLKNDEINDKRNEIEKIYNNFYLSIKKPLENLINSELLDEYSFNINGYAPAYNKIIELINNCNKIIEETYEIKEVIKDDFKEHRTKEHDKYEEKINKKIADLEEREAQIQRKIDNDINPVNSFFAGLYADRTNVRNEISRYKRKKQESENSRPQ